MSFKLNIISIFTFSATNINNNECIWGEYGAWTPCSVTCGDGNQQRHRFLLFETKSFDLTDSGCSEERNTETRTCSIKPCEGIFDNF